MTVFPLVTVRYRIGLIVITGVINIISSNNGAIKTLFILNWLNIIHEKVVLSYECSIDCSRHFGIWQVLRQLLSLVTFLFDFNRQLFFSITLLYEVSHCWQTLNEQLATLASAANLITLFNLCQIGDSHKVRSVLYLLENPHSLVIKLVSEWYLRLILFLFAINWVDLLDDVELLFKEHIREFYCLRKFDIIWSVVCQRRLVLFIIQLGTEQFKVPVMSATFIQYHFEKVIRTAD